LTDVLYADETFMKNLRYNTEWQGVAWIRKHRDKFEDPKSAAKEWEALTDTFKTVTDFEKKTKAFFKKHKIKDVKDPAAEIASYPN